MTSLNRLRWTHSGHQIAVGNDDGHVFIYDVGEVRTTRAWIPIDSHFSWVLSWAPSVNYLWFSDFNRSFLSLSATRRAET